MQAVGSTGLGNGNLMWSPREFGFPTAFAGAQMIGACTSPTATCELSSLTNSTLRAARLADDRNLPRWAIFRAYQTVLRSTARDLCGTPFLMADVWCAMPLTVESIASCPCRGPGQAPVLLAPPPSQPSP